jgi:beta-glucosidase/6-phospho-beta-glucosidase/beta-galactosidase
MAGPTKLTVTDSSKTDNDNYRVYPQGLWRAIAEVSEKLAEPLGIPMYVTENGIATQDDALRNSFYQKYMYALTKAVDDGFNVRGYLTWTLADNYEWPKDDAKKRSYGLLHVDENNPSQLIIKDGARWYQEFVHNALA